MKWVLVWEGASVRAPGGHFLAVDLECQGHVGFAEENNLLLSKRAGKGPSANQPVVIWKQGADIGSEGF